MPPKTPKNVLPKELEEHLAAGNFEAIEEYWLARLEAVAKSSDWEVLAFSNLARAIVAAGGAETARFLLELLDEQLVDRDCWAERLDLLRRVGHLLFEPEDLHPAIVETLDDLHGDQPSYQLLAEKVGLHRAVDDLPKIWKKVDRLQGLMDFDVGSIVHMKGKGAGKVLDVNMALESFKVKFETGLELRVGFGGAAKLLKSLKPEHVLYRKMMEPEALIALRDENPAELLHLVLRSYPKPRTGAEIKRTLAGVVPEGKWARWWAAARKHPQVLAASEGRRAYTWAESSEHAHEAIWESFEEADPRGRLDLLRRNSDRDSDLNSRMTEALIEDAERSVDKDPGLACDIWFSLEKNSEAPVLASWSPQSLISDLEDLRPVFKGIKDRLARERSYEIVRESREDWDTLFYQFLLQESDARSLDLLAGALEGEFPERLESFLDLLLSQPRRNPAAFTWFVERAGDRADWLSRNLLRLLNQLLWALTNDAFAAFRASRLMPHLEDGGVLPRLIANLEEEQAPSAYSAIRKAPGLKSYQREPLLNAILLRFPVLREETETPLYATETMIRDKRAELKKLTEVEIPANRKAIEEARELGDLSENFEYKSARQRHEYLAARASNLNRDLGRARPIDASQVQGKEVVIGAKVGLKSADGTERTITILGPWDSKPERDILSHESEIAKSLLGLALGDSVQLGALEFQVESIEPFE